MKVKSIQVHPYDGIERGVGCEYEMHDRDFEVMHACGHVVAADFQGRDMGSNAPKKYRRRDMKAD